MYDRVGAVDKGEVGTNVTYYTGAKINQARYRSA